MTAEIAIMNRNAVALASDSAATVQTDEGPKIYNTVNKLFMLSEVHPVGIMIYGAASFFDIPWSTIIKEYRRKLGKDEFDELGQYAESFINFLNGNTQLFPKDQQLFNFKRHIYSIFSSIREAIEDSVKAELDCDVELSEKDISALSGRIIRKRHKDLNKSDDLTTAPEGHYKNILTQYSDAIGEVYAEVFEKLPIYQKDKNLLSKIAALYFTKEWFPAHFSGIVIAGFGKKDFFPKLYAYIMETVACDAVKYIEHKHSEISFENSVIITPFAQAEMVFTFMEGIDPALMDYNHHYLAQVFDKYPDAIIKAMNSLGIKTKDELKDKIAESGVDLFRNYLKDLDLFRHDKYVNPVIEVVSILPKDELAAMAEALVNLTKLKRRVTIGAETVGGPVDVAIISKGDGFIWVKRKYYFDKELNPRYVARTKQLGG